jgi:hypothetical protein
MGSAKITDSDGVPMGSINIKEEPGIEVKDGVVSIDLLQYDMGKPNWLTVKPIKPPPAVQRQAKQALAQWTDGSPEIRKIAESLAAGEGQDGATLTVMVRSMSKTAQLPQRDRWNGHDAAWQAWFGLGGRAGYNWAKSQLAEVGKLKPYHVPADATR